MNKMSLSKIDTESLSRWIVALCSIRFDLEQGQLIEECFPASSLSLDEELNVSFSSFPDSISQQHIYNTTIHDCIFFFRFKRQRHDERLKRGGEQKSVVILSHFPYSSVFKPLLQILGPLYFDIGSKALEHIATYVSQWPSPVPGKIMELAIGNAKLKINLPPAHS